MTSRIKQTLILLLVAVTSFACSGPKPALITLTGNTMGTTYTVKYWSPIMALDPQLLSTEIDSDLILVNQQMSTYIDDSELMRLNRWPAAKVFPLSDSLRTVLTESIRLYGISEGSLDVTVGPLVNLWGFGPEAKPDMIPSDADITAAYEKVGVDKLILSKTSVTKDVADMFIDLSTIAKGYGVDVVAQRLIDKGLTHFLVEIGGELRLAGHKPDGQQWKLAIEKPVSHNRQVQQVISVGDNAVATAGDYRNFYQKNGNRYSHLIDPTTGYPITHLLASVTVVHPSAMTADGLATALMIMGPEKGMALAKQHGIDALFVVKTAHGFDTVMTDSFEPFLVVN